MLDLVRSFSHALQVMNEQLAGQTDLREVTCQLAHLITPRWTV